MNAVVAPEAEKELTDGAFFYANEANADLGLAFIGEFEHALSVLAVHPTARRTLARSAAPLSTSPLSIKQRIFSSASRRTTFDDDHSGRPPRR